MEVLTVTVVVQVAQLIAPLSDNSKRILQEGDDDEETSYRWEISFQFKSATALPYPLFPTPVLCCISTFLIFRLQTGIP